MGSQPDVPAQIVLSRGGPIHSNRARRITCDRTSVALADLLHDTATPEECSAWWSPCLFEGSRRQGEGWEGADVLAMDLDHVQKRPLQETERADLHRALSSFPGNVYHDTPKGCRIVVILTERITSREVIKKAQEGFAALVRTALLHLLWLAIDTGVLKDVYARALYTPRGHPKPAEESEPRDAPVRVMRRELYTVDYFITAAPTTTLKPASKPNPGTAQRHNRIQSVSSSPEFRAAAKRWNTAHPRTYTTPDRECPACGHHGSFGPVPSASDSWFCFSDSHETDSRGCGRFASSEMGWSGDALDLEAHRRRKTPAKVLQDDGYLDPGLRVPLHLRDTVITGPTEDAIVVTNVEDAHRHVTDALTNWRIGESSVQVVGAAGSGKTTAAILELLAHLDRGDIRIGIIAEHTAALVVEKAKLARSLIEPGSSTRIEILLGARPETQRGFHCAHPGHRAALSELGMHSCKGCALFDNGECSNSPGRFRRDTARAMESITKATRILVVTTHARLQILLRDLGPLRHKNENGSSTPILEETAVVIDDDGRTAGGLLVDTELQADVVESARELAQAALANGNAPTAWAAFDRHTVVIPDLAVAGIVAQALIAIEDSEPEGQPLRDLAAKLRRLHPTFASRLEREAYPWSRWDFEQHSSSDGSDLRPALAAQVMYWLSLELRGHGVTFVAERRRNLTVRWKVRTANTELAKMSVAGRVCWLDIGGIPAMVAGLLIVTTVRLESRPSRLTTIATSDRLFGQRESGVIRAVVEALHNKATGGGVKYDDALYKAPGAIIRKSIRTDLRAAGSAAHAATGHYGADHSATDHFSHCDVFLITRYALPPGTVPAAARALRRAFPNLPPLTGESTAAATRKCLAGWWGQPERWRVRVHVDSMEYDLDESWRRQHILNAAGRVRGLSSNKQKLLIVLDGEPCPGLFIDREMHLKELVTTLGLDWQEIEQTIVELRQAAIQSRSRRTSDGEERQLLAVRIVDQWIHTFCAPPTMAELRSELEKLGHRLSRQEFRNFRASLDGYVIRGRSDTIEPIRPNVLKGTNDTIVTLPKATEVARCAAVSLRTAERRLNEIRRWIGGGAPPVLARSHARKNWISIVKAMRDLMTTAGTWEALSGHPLARVALFDPDHLHAIQDGSHGSESPPPSEPPPDSQSRPGAPSNPSENPEDDQHPPDTNNSEGDPS